MLAFVCAVQVVLGPPAPRDAELDRILATLPTVACERHLDEHEKPEPAAAVEELRAFVARRALDDEAWRRALVKSQALRWRKRWPVDRPFAVSLAEPSWLTDASAPWSEIRLVAEVNGWHEATAGHLELEWCGIAIFDRLESERYQVLGRLSADPSLGSLVVPCQVFVQRRRNGEHGWGGGPCELLWRGTLELDVEPVATLEEALPGAHDAALDRAVRDSLAATLTLATDAPPALFVELVPDPSVHPELARLALALDVELRHAGSTVGQTAVDFTERFLDSHHAREGCGPWDTLRATSVMRPVPHALRDAATDFPGWTVRVRGTSRGVLEDWDAERYWNGEFELALAELCAPRPDGWAVPVGRRPTKQ